MFRFCLVNFFSSLKKNLKLLESVTRGWLEVNGKTGFRKRAKVENFLCFSVRSIFFWLYCVLINYLPTFHWFTGIYDGFLFYISCYLAPNRMLESLAHAAETLCCLQISTFDYLNKKNIISNLLSFYFAIEMDEFLLFLF